MAFTPQSFFKASVNVPPIGNLQSDAVIGAPSFWSYYTTDTLATTLVANYFSAVAGEMNVGDMIYVYASDRIL